MTSAPDPARCTCGTLIPCDAHETATDRLAAMRKIREKMTADLREFAASDDRLWELAGAPTYGLPRRDHGAPAALILTASSHTIACVHCNAPWPVAVAQCPGCGRLAVASITARAAPPSPDDLRAQLAAVTAERDALRAIVEGRTTPPTTEEIAAASKPNSFWLCEHNGFAWLVRFVADDGVWIEVDGEPWEPVAPRLARLSPGRWWFLLNGAPAAWPTVPA